KGPGVSAGITPSATGELYANHSAMPSAIHVTPLPMHTLPPVAYCQRWMYSCAASSVRSVSAVQVSGAAAGGATHAAFEVTILKLSPRVRQQYGCVSSLTIT